MIVSRHEDFEVLYSCRRLEDFVALSSTDSVVISPGFPQSLPDYSLTYYFQATQDPPATARLLAMDLGAGDNCMLATSGPDRFSLCGRLADPLQLPAFPVNDAFRVSVASFNDTGSGIVLAVVPGNSGWDGQSLDWVTGVELDYERVMAAIPGFPASEVAPNVEHALQVVQLLLGPARWEAARDEPPAAPLAAFAHRCLLLLDPFATDPCNSTEECLEVIDLFMRLMYEPSQEREKLEADALLFRSLLSLLEAGGDFRPAKRSLAPVQCPQHTAQSGLVFFSAENYTSHCPDASVVASNGSILVLYWFWAAPPSNKAVEQSSFADINQLECLTLPEHIKVTELHNGSAVDAECIPPGALTTFRGQTNSLHINYFSSDVSLQGRYVAYYQAFPATVSSAEITAWTAEVAVNESLQREVAALFARPPPQPLLEHRETEAWGFPADLSSSRNFLLTAPAGDASRHAMHELRAALGDDVTQVVLLTEPEDEDTLPLVLMLVPSSDTVDLAHVTRLVSAALANAGLSLTLGDQLRLGDFNECLYDACPTFEQCVNSEGGFQCYDTQPDSAMHAADESTKASLIVAGAVVLLVVIGFLLFVLYRRCCKKNHRSYILSNVSVHPRRPARS